MSTPLVRHARGVPVIVAPRPVPSVVSWLGSIETYPQFGFGEELTQDIVTSLLNKGTRRLDRFALAADLEDRGANIHFGSYPTSVHFSGKALSRDVEHVLKLTVEQLSEPLLAADEFDKTVRRMRASVKRSTQSTSYRASVALRQRLFSDTHPNFSQDPAADLEQLSAVSIEDVKAYHASRFKGASAIVCAAGDFDPDEFAAMVGNAFEHWDGEGLRGTFDEAGQTDEDASRTEIDLPDRDNLDVRIGHAVHLKRDHPDYLPLYVANYILGGNFSARLMAKIRNEMGLTYGIGSSLVGFDTAYEGMWQVAVTLSKDRLEEGIEATLAEVRRFLGSGVTEDELASKKTTICGSYEVGLSTTGGLAQRMHANHRNGFDPGYLDDFPDAVRSLSLDQVNAAAAKYLDFNRLRVTVAGTLPEGK